MRKIEYLIALTLVVLGLACLTMSGSYLLEQNIAVYAMTFLKICLWIGIPIVIVWVCVFLYRKKKKRRKKIMNYIHKLSFFVFVLLSLPINAFAHGSEEEHQRETFLSNLMEYGFYTLLALFLLSIVVLWFTNIKIKQIDVKKQTGRKEKEGKEKIRRLLQISMGVLLLATALTGVFTLSNKKDTANGKNESNAVDFMHIHGLGYSNNGNEVFIPAHDGLRVFINGKLSIPEGEKHDYMGFAVTDDGFYSSGHPAPGSTMKNPFGIVKSTDMGKTIENLDLYEEIDFHGMAVGYKSHAIYVLNPEANSRMDDAGLYYTLDETKTWERSEMDGLVGQPSAIAVHPSDQGTVVFTTNEGVFLSKDFGNKFEKLLPTLATAATFTIDGKLVIGNIENGASIIEVDINSGEQSKISVPTLGEEDAISYIAVSPQSPEELVFTTYSKDIFKTKDKGEKWEKLADKGVSVEGKENNAG
jgi:hypothetical protein